jgi:hypothetical protein
MRDLRGPLPLTDADFARIRANVMASVRPKRTVFAFRWAFAMLAAAFVGVVSYKSLPVAPRMEPVTIPAPLTLVHPERTETPQPPNRRVEEIAPPRKAAARRQPTNRPTDQPTNPTPLRMEIQTSDPDIRIIWLPNHYDPKSEETS